ncbi:exodeoxyribonuclease VII small subunit [Aliidiomarina minuta]|uniref:Exodeoxyribonuclease 7 small subunit n=1 Tax=Aliidiomarina minuta TaxID=880057 RepID=A0A432W4Q2_9GAMM|nr:exodeoxyribonuclease VII small subunit [Aliidiomarina minuta]RUO24414.1 exodeoxyribonuclease VII small subunit [Aliidiomarina minuta]
MSDQQATSEATFEQAMNELEKIVSNLEQGDLPLEQSLQQFERAIELSRLSQQKLQQAEQKVSMLLRQGQEEELKPLADNGPTQTTE